MATTKGLIITIYCLYNTLAQAQYQQPVISFWDNVKPGELLQTLDTITADAQNLQLADKAENASLIKRRNIEIPRVQRRVGDGGGEESLEEDNSKSLENEKTHYDYDRAYDEFVKKYFDDSVTEALSSSESTENKDVSLEAETYSGEVLSSSEETEPFAEASKKSTKKEKCKKVVRGRESCLICKTIRNGETSENCSYNKETKPQNYAFETQKNYRKYRESPKKSDDVTSEEISREKKSASVKKPIKTLQKRNDTSSCIIKIVRNTVCYHCENNNGEKMTKCYNNVPVKLNKDDEINDGNKKKFQKSHQRIYKRTISYTYENSPHLTSSENESGNETNVMEKPLIKKHFLIEEVKEKDSSGL